MIRTADHEVVQFDGPVLELMTDGRTRFDPRIAQLGPDVLADEFDEAAFLARLREDDQTRTLGDALLDQRIVAGHREHLEGGGLLRGGHRPVAAAARRHATTRRSRSIHAVRPLMHDVGRRAASRSERPEVYKRAGPPCPRCGTMIQRARPGRRQPHHLLVPGVPDVKRVGHKGADLVAPGNTVASFEAALEHGVDMIEFDVLRLRDGRLVLAHDYEDAGQARRR